jgi:hypothetical protein
MLARMDTDIRGLLRPGERVFWSGQPNSRDYALQGGCFLIAFTTVWFGFAVFWETIALLGGAPIPFLLFGALFVSIGSYFAFGRLWVAYREARRTTYAVTSDRVLFVSGSRSQSELAVDALPSLRMDRRRKGRGVIWFSDPGPWGNWMSMWPGYGAPRPLAFYAIDDVDRVFELIRQARDEARQRR